MKNLKFNKKTLNVMVGIIAIAFGVFVLNTLTNMLLEDMGYRFGYLRYYAWNWEYYLLHMWMYPLLMIIIGGFIIFNKKDLFLEFFIIGFILFFLDTFLFSLSILNLIMLIIFIFYYYKTYLKNLFKEKILIIIVFVFVHFIIIFSSKYFVIKVYNLIINNFI